MAYTKIIYDYNFLALLVVFSVLGHLPKSKKGMQIPSVVHFIDHVSIKDV